MNFQEFINIEYCEDNIDNLNIYKIEFLLVHSDWSDICIIDNHKIYRKTDDTEFGNYSLVLNKLTVYWDKWKENIFYNCNNEYYLDSYINFILINDIKYILNNFNNKI